MSIKKPLILLIILAVLGGYYYVVEVRMAEKKEVAEQAEKKLFTVQETDIQAVTLSRQDSEIVLEKQDDMWKLVQPVTDTADLSAVEAMLTQFTSAERAQSITGKTSDLQQFGLDAPGLVVRVTTVDDTFTLSLGNKTPTAAEYYAQINDNPAVITINSTVYTGLDKSVYDVRDKTVLAFEPTQITQATFTIRNSETDVPREIVLDQENDQWAITAPAAFKADTAKMGSMLSKIKSSQIQEFVAETPKDLTQYGLEQPRAQLTLTVGEDNAQKTLLLGNANEAETGIYATHAAASAVFLVPPDIFEEFPKGVNDLRDTTLFSYNNDDVRQIELIADGEEPLVLEQIAPTTEDTESLWNIVHPHTYEAITSKVRSWLWDAQNVTVEQFVTDEPANMSLYGLDPPQAALKIWLAEQEAPQELLLGNADVEQTGLYAKLGTQDSVVLINSEAREKLTRSINDLRDTQILPLMTEMIEKISITHADTTLVLEKKGDSWRSTQPEKQELTAYKVNNLLYDLDALTFLEDVHSPEADLGIYGLDDPEVEVALWEKWQKDSMNIRIGKALEGREERYLKRSNVPTVYTIDAAFLDELPKSLADLTE